MRACGFTHYLQLGNAFTALADTGANAVVARVAAPYDDHILALCRGTVSPIQQGTGCPCQEVHCKPDVHSRPTWYVQISGLGRAAAENHRVKLFPQLLLTHVPARVHTGAEGYPSTAIRSSRRWTTDFSSFMLGMPYISRPPGRSARSNTVTL